MLASLHGGLTWCIVQRGLALSETGFNRLTVPARADQMFGWSALLGSGLAENRTCHS